MTSHAERIAAIEAERAAMPAEQRLQVEAADAPMLRISLRYALERAELAEARPTDVVDLEQGLAAMTKLAEAWQKEAERARKNLVPAADLADDAELRIWGATERPLTVAEVCEHLAVLRNCRFITGEAIHLASDTIKDAKKRVTALHHPIRHLGKDWCAECSVRRRTGPHSDDWVAFIPHPCPTLNALDNKDA